MAGHSYSNADLMQAIGRIEEKVDHVTKLAEHTNGRVTKLEAKQIAAEAVESYKKDQPVIQHAEKVEVKQGIDKKMAGFITAGTGALIALSAYLNYLASRGGQP